MRGKTYRGAWLLAAWMALVVGAVQGQSPGQTPQYAPADPPLPIPLGSTRPEDGGLFLGAEYLFFHQTNPVKDQVVGTRGFQLSDNSITGFQPGGMVGSGAVALHTAQVTGADSYQPGFRLSAGWHFGSDGSSVSFSYFFLTEADYRAGATLAAKNNNNNLDLSNTFLFAPVFNFPPEYAGPNNKIQIINPLNGEQASVQAAHGIWNGASIMTLNFIQRFQEWEITYRQPIYETENSRCSGLIGPRFDWFWETFQWRTTAYSIDPTTGAATAGPQSTAMYSALTSNRMYGAFAGTQYECYLGHGFALQCEARTALLMDAIHEIARYELLDRFQGLPESKRAKRIWNVVPEVQGTIGLQWYPYEFIQIQVGYQFMAFFNTLSARKPIDFDYSNVDPHWSTVSRFMDGFTAGIGITF